MGFESSHRYAHVTARKARPVADLVRGLNVNRALDVLGFQPRRAASLFLQVIRSALAIAGQEQGVNLNQLVVKEIYVNDGPLLHRKFGRPVARGRFHRIQKRSSHLHVVLDAPAPAPEGLASAKSEPASPKALEPESSKPESKRPKAAKKPAKAGKSGGRS